MPLAPLAYWLVAYLHVTYLLVAYLHVAYLLVAYLLVVYLLVALLGGGAFLLLRSWRFIVWRVGPHGCLPPVPPFSKHLHLSWSSVIFGGDP